MRQVAIWARGGSMEDTVDRVIACCENVPALEQIGRQEIRIKLGQYLANLASAGHRDPDDLGVMVWRICVPCMSPQTLTTLDAEVPPEAGDLP